MFLEGNRGLLALARMLFVIAASFFIAVLACMHLKLEIFLTVLFGFGVFAIIFGRAMPFKEFFYFVLFIFPLLPFQLGYYFGPFAPVLHIHRVFIVLLIICWLAQSKTIAESFRCFPFKGLFFLLFMLMTIASLFSLEMFYSLFKVGVFILEYFLFCVLVFDVVKDKTAVMKICKLVSISMFIVAIIGIIEYFTGKNIYFFVKPYHEKVAYAIQHQVRLEGSIRIKGSFDHAISFGVALALSSVAAIFSYKMECRPSWKGFYLLMIFVMWFAVFLTQARSAIILMFIIGTPMVVKDLPKKFIFFGLVFLGGLIVANADKKMFHDFIVLLQSSFDPFSDVSNDMLNSTKARIELLKNMLPILQNNMFLGYGRIDFGVRSIDNFWLLFALQYGIISVLVLFVIMIKAIKMGYVCFKRMKVFEYKYLCGYLALAFVGIIFVWAVLGLESYFYLFWVYLAILFRIHTVFIGVGPYGEN